MTDEEHAEAIRRHLEGLRRAIDEAKGAGLAAGARSEIVAYVNGLSDSAVVKPVYIYRNL